jgi:putative Ca2+/H+ antiporter (TMEM165/GDT1 family)
MLENLIRDIRRQLNGTEMVEQFDITDKLAINIGFVGDSTHDVTGTNAMLFTHFNAVSVVIALQLATLTRTALRPITGRAVAKATLRTITTIAWTVVTLGTGVRLAQFRKFVRHIQRLIFLRQI